MAPITTHVLDGPPYIIPFTGTFDGNNYNITNLFINQPGSDLVGLFGMTGAEAALINITLIDANVTGGTEVTGAQPVAGALVGINSGTITNCSVSGTVTGNETVGVLAGENRGIITGNSASGTVNGKDFVGGLVGSNSIDFDNGTLIEGSITDSIADTTVIASGNWIGGLAGYSYGYITGSSATGDVIGIDQVGGLVGTMSGTATVEESFATGDVTGGYHVGGLVGSTQGESTIATSFATGNVYGTKTGDRDGDYIGGLVGSHSEHCQLTDSYATGNVAGNCCVGGLVGANYGRIVNTYAAGDVIGTVAYGGLAGSYYPVAGYELTSSYYDQSIANHLYNLGEPRSTAQLLQQETYHDWYFATTWSIEEGISYPYLQWQTVSIATSSEIAVGAENPTVVITLSGDTYNVEGAQNTENWTIRTGETNLTVDQVTRNSDTNVTISFSGTAAGGTIQVKAKKAALAGDSSSNMIAFLVVPETGGTIAGTVRSAVYDTVLEDYPPIAGATVKVDEVDNPTPLAETTTDSDGHYSLDVIAGTGYEVDFSARGYVSAVESGVNVVGDQTNTINKYLEPIILESSITTIQVKTGSESIVIALNNTEGEEAVGVALGVTVASLTIAIESTDVSSQTYAVTDSGGVAKNAGDPLETGDKLLVTAENGIDNSEYLITVGFAGGTGTAGEPYKIATAEQLNNVRNHLGAYYILIDNLDLADYLSESGDGYNSGAGWDDHGDGSPGRCAVIQ